MSNDLLVNEQSDAIEFSAVGLAKKDLETEVPFQVSLYKLSRTSPHDDGIGASFLLGHSGIYAVSALVFNALGWYRCCTCMICHIPVHGTHLHFHCPYVKELGLH